MHMHSHIWITCNSVTERPNGLKFGLYGRNKNLWPPYFMQHVRQNMFLHSIYAIAYFCLYAICISVITKKGIAAIVHQSWISVLSLNIDIEWSDCTKKIFICQWNISIQMLSSSSSKRDWDSCSQNSDSSNMDCDCDAESKLWDSILSSSALELDNDDDDADATKGCAI